MKYHAGLLLLGLSSFVHSASISSAALDEALRNDLHGQDHFGAQLVLTPDEKQFVRVWKASSTPLDLPAIASVKRGSSVTALLVFQGCAKNAQGRCDVIADFTLQRPDGANVRAGSTPLWSSEPSPGRLHLGNGSMQLSFDASDRIGRYRVSAVVRDRVSGQTLNLRAGLEVRD